MGIVSKLLAGGEVSERLVEQTEGTTFVRVDDPIRSYSSFFWRLALSAVIAAGGIAGDSTAVVVGAMLVAPLMLPMIGTMLAVVRGNGKAIVRTLVVTAAGAGLAIVVAAAVAAIVPVNIDMSSNSQILARTSPRLVDLMVALAAGFVAALSVIREDIPDAAPGIAIAVSIVPPLCVVGISLFEGDLLAAAGAFLLFSANYLAILAMALVVFVLAGVGKGASAVDGGESAGGIRSRRTWYAIVLIGLVVVSIPLAITSASAIEHAKTQSAAFSAASEWLDGTGYEAQSVKVVKNEVDIAIAGQGDAPSAEDYLSLLESEGVKVNSANVIVLYEEKASADGRMAS